MKDYRNAKFVSIEELEQLVAKGEIREHHTSWQRGYVSRKNPPKTAWAYKGKFGEGFTLESPSWNTTSYCHITYYIWN